jgi:RNA polymerase sigma-70 factor, ECF subfamily
MSATLLQPSECLFDVLAAARTGDSDAFAALIMPYVPRLRRLARRFTRNVQDAEDVCQESLLKAFTKLHRFTGTQDETKGDFRSWLMRITANSAIDFVRRRQSGRFVPLEECEPVLSESPRIESRAWRENPEASYARKERLRIIAGRIAELPAELRRVCVLRNVMELSTEEVATRLGISTAAVRLRLFRAHGRMKKPASSVAKDGRVCRRAVTRRSRASRDFSKRNEVRVLSHYGGKLNVPAVAEYCRECPILGQEIPASQQSV